MSVYVNFDTSSFEKNLTRILKRKIEYQGLSKGVKKEITYMYRDAIRPYVPMKTGKLRRGSRVVTDGEDFAIRYSAKAPKTKYDYAAKQYYTPVDPERRFTPGTFDHWNRHLSILEREKFYRDAARIITEAMNE